jgi:hypothetical protein
MMLCTAYVRHCAKAKRGCIPRQPRASEPFRTPRNKSQSPIINHPTEQEPEADMLHNKSCTIDQDDQGRGERCSEISRKTVKSFPVIVRPPLRPPPPPSSESSSSPDLRASAPTAGRRGLRFQKGDSDMRLPNDCARRLIQTGKERKGKGGGGAPVAAANASMSAAPSKQS